MDQELILLWKSVEEKLMSLNQDNIDHNRLLSTVKVFLSLVDKRLEDIERIIVEDQGDADTDFREWVLQPILPLITLRAISYPGYPFRNHINST